MEIIDELIANLTYTFDYSVVGFSDNTIMIIASNNDESKRYRGIPTEKVRFLSVDSSLDT